MGVGIVVGIGNPGIEYEGTRHNLGFEVIREIIERHGTSFSWDRFHAQVFLCSVMGRSVLCLKPQLFVNNSGISVRSILDYYNASLEDLCVICDDVNISCGKIRLKRSGSSGGHRGLESVIDECRSDKFSRLKIGIGQDYISDMTSYVLGVYTDEEKEILTHAVAQAADALELWLSQGIEHSMNVYN